MMIRSRMAARCIAPRPLWLRGHGAAYIPHRAMAASLLESMPRLWTGALGIGSGFELLSQAVHPRPQWF